MCHLVLFFYSLSSTHQLSPLEVVIHVQPLLISDQQANLLLQVLTVLIVLYITQNTHTIIMKQNQINNSVPKTSGNTDNASTNWLSMTANTVGVRLGRGRRWASGGSGGSGERGGIGGIGGSGDSQNESQTQSRR